MSKSYIHKLEKQLRDARRGLGMAIDYINDHATDISDDDVYEFIEILEDLAEKAEGNDNE